jgi:ketosteroid isomerase-like protein
MGGALETETRRLFDALDRKDADAIIQSAGDDVQGVDEISRRWLRGLDVFGGYFRQAMTAIEDAHSTISDVHEKVYGEIGFVTCWLEQDYTYEGNPTHVSAPTTVAFHREGGKWKLLLVHSIPVPPEE